MPASIPRRCALEDCGVEFVPASPKQRFHSDHCRYIARDQRKAAPKVCANCGKPVPPGFKYRRFDSNACKWAYLSRRSGDSRKRAELKVEQAEVAVLLPLGCAPRRSPQVEDPEEVQHTRRLTCRRYERCLAYVVSKGWGGFTCNTCSVHEPSEKR